MVSVIVRSEFGEYFFPNNLSVRVMNAGDGKINVILRDGTGKALINHQRVCNITNKGKCKKIALQFFKNYCLNYGLDPNIVKLDHEERYFLVGAIDRAKNQVVREDTWMYVFEEKLGIRISCPWGDEYFKTKISSSKDVRSQVIEVYRKHQNI